MILSLERKSTLPKKKKQKKVDEGEEAENLVVSILQKFIETKKKFKNGIRVVSFIRANKSDTLDRNGIDILIIFDSFLALPLQVKKSCSRRQRHQRKYPHIHYVFGVGDLPQNISSPEYHAIVNRLAALINEALTLHSCSRSV